MDTGVICTLTGAGILLLLQDVHRVGMELQARMISPEELACYTMTSDGKDRCHVANKYMTGKRGLHLNHAIIRITEDFYQQ
jgi:hypothetical protein